MSVTNHGDEKPSAGSGFNFRSALKRMTGPWKATSKSNLSIDTATPDSIQEEPENKDSHN
ncbi:hypothetical protein DSO57_1011811 [Entomophthora muscae]|uniref:Uncharacterized protein n=2 Tax=Entomophthora muscae TaxID=34485 RepID=A0ACC2UEF5_9FUNG|nr:hypothetical protein DSO57_1017110 [Entomophthora muscae]KAJ9085662.1 hypothetical protein DSO57_1011811 [Entomophthora muscae]